MGVSEREKQELRQSILDAAMALFLEYGYDKVSIRNIAERIEYSPGTIYLYFKDKDDIFFSLHLMAFEKLWESMTQSAGIPDPLERIRSIGHTYLDFAIQNPDLYDLMFILRDPMNALDPACIWEEGCKSYDFLKDAIVEAMNNGQLPTSDPDVVSISAWAIVHGLASLHIRNRLKMFEDKVLSELIHQCVDQWMLMLRCAGCHPHPLGEKAAT